METRNGIPILGFGTWPLSSEEAYRAISTALEVGFRHIDTAQMYGNEREVGRALEDSGLPRSELFIVTKVAPDNLGAERFLASVERSLIHLGGPVDLLLIHWPPRTDLEGAIDRLAEARSRGHARAIGVSNFNAAMMKRAVAHSPFPIIDIQVEFHPLIDQSRLKAEKLGLVLSAYSPLGRGVVLKEQVIQDIARKHGRPPAQIVLRWIIQQGVVAIPMTTKRENARSNMRALEFKLPQADMDAISALTRNRRRLISPAGWAPDWDS